MAREQPEMARDFPKMANVQAKIAHVRTKMVIVRGTMANEHANIADEALLKPLKLSPFPFEWSKTAFAASSPVLEFVFFILSVHFKPTLHPS